MAKAPIPFHRSAIQAEETTIYGYRPADVIRVGGDKGKPGESIVGPRGPQGEKGEPGKNGTLDLATTDNLPEGTENLYHTHERAELVAQSVVAVHVVLPDPHPQYLDDDDVIDGGNF